jgi:hypothetical protein
MYNFHNFNEVFFNRESGTKARRRKKRTLKKVSARKERRKITFERGESEEGENKVLHFSSNQHEIS